MKRPLLKLILRIALPCIFASVAVPVLLITFGNPLTLPEAFLEFRAAALYSLCIGGLLSTVIPTLWERSQCWARPLRWIARILAIAGGTALGTMLAGACLLLVWPGHYDFWNSFWHSYRVSLILTSVVVCFLVTYETHKEQLQATRMQLKQKEVERERALKLATAARLSSLESRVRPHFLFNTLNSVASLIHEDPRRAEAMVNQLAELLRFSLDSAQGGLVPLEREMRIVEDYLEIEKARFAGRLRYSFDVAAGLGATPVPPLAVQTLVENAVKYAAGPSVSGATICISAHPGEGLLRLAVADDGPGFSCSDIPAGHGLNNLEERLAALYGDDNKLHIESSAGGTVVTLSIPLNVAKAA
jgi:sensor histidine kinase YesM